VTANADHLLIHHDWDMSNQRVAPEDCTHPARGSQEHILGGGTGDYHCRQCGEAMPIIAQAPKCGKCNVDYEPDPTHGAAWRCPGCGEYWGWVRKSPR
jgi:predicted RNA-binding Zn-ribbon protein involved in translation (DUF1610 family)